MRVCQEVLACWGSHGGWRRKPMVDRALRRWTIMSPCIVRLGGRGGGGGGGGRGGKGWVRRESEGEEEEGRGGGIYK